MGSSLFSPACGGRSASKQADPQRYNLVRPSIRFGQHGSQLTGAIERTGPLAALATTTPMTSIVVERFRTDDTVHNVMDGTAATTTFTGAAGQRTGRLRPTVSPSPVGMPPVGPDSSFTLTASISASAVRPDEHAVVVLLRESGSLPITFGWPSTDCRRRGWCARSRRWRSVGRPVESFPPTCG